MRRQKGHRKKWIKRAKQQLFGTVHWGNDCAKELILNTGSMALFSHCTGTIHLFGRKPPTYAPCRNSLFVSKMDVDSQSLRITSQGYVECSEVIGQMQHKDINYQFYLHSPNAAYAQWTITAVAWYLASAIAHIGKKTISSKIHERQYLASLEDDRRSVPVGNIVEVDSFFQPTVTGALRSYRSA